MHLVVFVIRNNQCTVTNHLNLLVILSVIYCTRISDLSFLWYTALTGKGQDCNTDWRMSTRHWLTAAIYWLYQLLPPHPYSHITHNHNGVALHVDMYIQTSEMLLLEHGSVWCWKLDAPGNRSEVPGKFWNVVLEKDGEDHLDRSCEKWRSVT